ncbi:MAG: hypothetical protein AB7V42_06520 [Thermoleophilia bacterium]
MRTDREPATLAPPATPPRGRDALTAGQAGGLAAVAVLSLVTLVLLAADVRAGLVGLAFLLLAPGAVVRHALRTSPAARGAVVVSVAVSVTLLALVATVSAWLEGWHPRGVTIALAAVTAAAALWPLWRGRGDLDRHARAASTALRGLRVGRPAPPAAALLVLLAAAALAWVAALPSIDPADAAQGGLLVGASPLLAVSLALAIAGFLAAVRLGSWPVALLALVVTALPLRATTLIVADEPMFDWTFKHVGVVDFIAGHGRLAGDVDIYQSWPGFFAGSAWITDVTGIGPVAQARWFTVAITALTCLAVYALARQALGASPPAGLVAAQLVLVLNWIGQDYFAPQALGFLMAIVVLRMVLLGDRRADALALLLFVGMVISHQLTPFWVLGVVCVLALARRVRPWLAVAFAAVSIGYLLTRLDVLDQYGIFSGFDVVENAQTSGGGAPSAAKQIDSWAGRLAMGAAWLATVAVLALRMRRRRDWIVGAALTFVPFGFLVVQRYGGEGILRVALFSLVGCAVVSAPAITHALRAARPWRAAAAGAAVLAVGACAAQAYFGPWYVYQVTSAEVRVATRLLEAVPPPAYVAAAVPGWPDRPSGAYATWADLARDYDDSAFDGQLGGSDLSSDADLAQFERFLGARNPWPTFLVISPRMEAVDEYRGFYAAGALERMATELPQRPGWSAVIRDDGIVVLRYAPPFTRDTEAALWRP